jgi:CheY-like chemotaxis protein
LDQTRIRVLVADDEPHIRHLIASIIAHLGGIVVAEAADGEQALALLESTRPDMAVLDINMPRISGDEVLRRMLARRPEAVGVMMTAQDSIDVVGRCLDLGASNYILKSNSAEEIYRMMAEAWPGYEVRVREGRAA